MDGGYSRGPGPRRLRRSRGQNVFSTKRVLCSTPPYGDAIEKVFSYIEKVFSYIEKVFSYIDCVTLYPSEHMCPGADG